MTGPTASDASTIAADPVTSTSTRMLRVCAVMNAEEASMSTANDTPSPARSQDARRRAELLTGPSMLVRLTIKPMSKVLNPLVKKVAGRRHLAWAAQIHHEGRRSGRAYVTTAGARVHDGVIWIPLTFGTGSDWCRNVLAARECGVRWKAADYTGANPVVLETRAAMASAKKAFRLPERGFMRVFGIKHFVRLDVRPLQRSTPVPSGSVSCT
jgi:hypothetical protein